MKLARLGLLIVLAMIVSSQESAADIAPPLQVRLIGEPVAAGQSNRSWNRGSENTGATE